MRYISSTFQLVDIIKVALFQEVNLKFLLQLDTSTEVMAAVDEKPNLEAVSEGPVCTGETPTNTDMACLEKHPKWEEAFKIIMSQLTIMER